MLTIVSAHSPVFSDESQQAIALVVKFEEFNEEIPFNATSYDSMPYGVELYNRAISGEFGVVAPFVPPEVVQPVSQGAQDL